MLQELLATGKPVVAVLFNGRPLAIPYVAENVPAILEAWHPGVEAGNAICDILFGDAMPSGKLTTTFPGASGQCPMYYAHMNTGRPGGKSKFTSKYLDAPLEPLFPFGYGLSYTKYAYSDLKTVVENQTLKASVTVSNTGSRDGEEVVQLYIRDLAADRVRPVKQLKAFRKIVLGAGEAKTVSFELPVAELGYYDWNMNYCVDDGEYRVFVGGSSADTLEAAVILK